ncbi:hypothetical protein VNO77_17172 [Canavalia gladiata]|uniref:Uncharacterized protein n=1 Tax=Canavalia gladiata TaxID=3824 RepID=A0AAN9LJ80_CANGL
MGLWEKFQPRSSILFVFQLRVHLIQLSGKFLGVTDANPNKQISIFQNFICGHFLPIDISSVRGDQYFQLSLGGGGEDINAD